jgi:hypothetical protein
MLHVPDVRATVLWYLDLGFELRRGNEEAGDLNWALLAYGNSEIMFDSFGAVSQTQRREVDLYIHTHNIASLRKNLAGHIEIVEDLHDTFYNMREFTIRDLNGFWITFGQPL